MTLRNSLIAFFLLLALGLSSWSIILSSKSPTITMVTKPGQPDAIMEDVEALIMNKEGKPSLKLETPKMIHFPENDITELMKPHVVIYRESPEPWHINAKHATTHKGVTEITFWDNVVIHHLADSDNPNTTMETTILTILPNQKLARTKEAIKVIQPDTTIHAIGMLANWYDGTVKLLSQAREEYVPNS